MTLLSAFSGGLWIIPLLISVGIIIFVVSGIKSSKSGAADGGANIPFVKTWQFVFALILTAALIGVVIWMNSEK